MKIALCLSGQPRNAIEISNRIINNIIDGNNVDVFLHAWFDKDNLNFGKRTPNHWHKSADPDIDKKLLDIYQPKAFIFEKPKFWENSNIKLSEENIARCFDYGLNDPNGIEYFTKYMVNVSHSQWYSNFKVNSIREDYSVSNRIKYDCIIKLRYDTAPSFKIGLNNFQINENTFYYQNLNQPLDMVSDWFGMGSQQTMNKWACLYFFIEQLYYQSIEHDNIWCNELLLKYFLKNNKINVQSLDWGISF